ncbi:hypothetical protein ARMGADRAFT_1166994 [Armillaria gallica]|uniref:Uncharacterized protein n=1 Tax=Armillaria gallica TaxID=47427 RepID=A0A2H3D4A4_ARMGA|nr:hypothetical protein ARMGADRAFT_1166994 [Armillaria gallica]
MDGRGVRTSGYYAPTRGTSILTATPQSPATLAWEQLSQIAILDLNMEREINNSNEVGVAVIFDKETVHGALWQPDLPYHDDIPLNRDAIVWYKLMRSDAVQVAMRKKRVWVGFFVDWRGTLWTLMKPLRAVERLVSVHSTKRPLLPEREGDGYSPITSRIPSIGLVIITGTQICNLEKGRWVELSSIISESDRTCAIWVDELSHAIFNFLPALADGPQTVWISICNHSQD